MCSNLLTVLFYYWSAVMYVTFIFKYHYKKKTKKDHQTRTSELKLSKDALKKTDFNLPWLIVGEGGFI